jgi:hypothetical protein
MAACVRFCEEDLSSLEQFNTAWRTQNDNIAVHIPAFQRMVIIYEKSKAYTQAIMICDHAVTFYHDNGWSDLASEFGERKKRLLLQKQKE